MVTFLPISSPFIRFAGRFVDDAFGVAAGWNFFVFEAALVPFEIVACNVIIGFWSEAVPTGAIIAIVIVLYAYVVRPFQILLRLLELALQETTRQFKAFRQANLHSTLRMSSGFFWLVDELFTFSPTHPSHMTDLTLELSMKNLLILFQCH